MKIIIKCTPEELPDIVKTQDQTDTPFYIQRDELLKIPPNVKEKPYVQKSELIKSLAVLKGLAFVDSKVRNMKLSELIYAVDQASTRSDKNSKSSFFTSKAAEGIFRRLPRTVVTDDYSEREFYSKLHKQLQKIKSLAKSKDD